MTVIVKDASKTVIYRFKRKFIRYFLCILINKIKGHEVDAFKEDF